jgi:hypothetical protein
VVRENFFYEARKVMLAPIFLIFVDHAIFLMLGAYLEAIADQSLSTRIARQAKVILTIWYDHCA